MGLFKKKEHSSSSSSSSSSVQDQVMVWHYESN